jgi:O-methyltransferase
MIDEVMRVKIRGRLTALEPDMKKIRVEQSLERIYLPRRPNHAVPQGALLELYDFALATIGDGPLLYLEFGVLGGRSISRMAERFRNADTRFFGFDSFEGLPDDWKNMPRSTFSTRGRMPVPPDPRVSFVKGWFQDTLPDFLVSLDPKLKSSVLIHYDADLYSSTLFVLSTLWHHIADYYFIFDEFMSQEIVALHDFCLAYPVELSFLSQTNSGGYPTQIFGRMRRVEFTRIGINGSGPEGETRMPGALALPAS